MKPQTHSLLQFITIIILALCVAGLSIELHSMKSKYALLEAQIEKDIIGMKAAGAVVDMMTATLDRSAKNLDWAAAEINRLRKGCM